MPFGEFQDFADCVNKNQDKDNPEGYCATIQKKIEGEKFRLRTNWITPVSSLIIKEANSGMNWLEIQGDAIHETTTRNNYIYTADELEKAAKTLENKPILKDHSNSVDSIVGKVTNSWFDFDSRSVKFRGKIMDEDVKTKVNDGRISAVSIGAQVQDLIEEEGRKDKFKVKGLEFLELSLVAIPGDPDASIGAKFEKIAESFKEIHKINNSYIPSITAVGTAGTVALKNATSTAINATTIASIAGTVEPTIKQNLEEKKMEEIEVQKLKETVESQTKQLAKLQETLRLVEQDPIEACIKLQIGQGKSENEAKAICMKTEAVEKTKGKIVTDLPSEDVYQEGRFTLIKDSKGYFVLEKGREGSSFFRIKSPEDLKGLN